MVAVTIIDCGIGNLRSVQKAFEKAGASPIISCRHEDIATARALVLPGVGAFGAAMQRLWELDLVELLRQEVLQSGKPILGICLGMQLLARSSEEGGTHDGLDLIPATVRRMDFTGTRDWAKRTLRLPHMGWNAVQPAQGSRLFNGIPAGSDFYFVHGYHVECDEPSMIAATCHYGANFVCGIEHRNIFAVQFHPEKSQKDGARLIGNYVRLCEEFAAAA